MACNEYWTTRTWNKYKGHWPLQGHGCRHGRSVFRRSLRPVRSSSRGLLLGEGRDQGFAPLLAYPITLNNCRAYTSINELRPALGPECYCEYLIVKKQWNLGILLCFCLRRQTSKRPSQHSRKVPTETREKPRSRVPSIKAHVRIVWEELPKNVIPHCASAVFRREIRRLPITSGHSSVDTIFFLSSWDTEAPNDN